MTLLIGEPLTGRELEQKTSGWEPVHFASMCDALAWAASGWQCPSLPEFTSRVNAKDGGIDAEWSVKLPENGSPISTPIIGPGWNVFQYKKRDLLAQDRRRILSNLKSSLLGAVTSVVKENNGRRPNRYVLFVNVDLKGSDKSALRKKIVEGCDEQKNLRVEIIGAAELASFLNNHPHLRAAYFVEGSFKTWEETYNAHRNSRLLGSSVELVGRAAELERLKSWIDDPYVRAIVLAGPHDSGKSRLVLEATRHRPHDVTLAPHSLSLADYRGLSADRGDVICIVEDPEPETIGLLINETLSSPRLKLVITLPTSAHVPAPSYGQDERVQTVHLKALSREEARQLLKVTGQPLDFTTEDWILDHAGGLPGVLLIAASVGVGLRTKLHGFAESVGREFARQVETELGAEALKCARLFSILTHVGIAGKVVTELKHICNVFGEGWTPNTVLLSLAVLERAGLARRGGSFAEITIPLLANHLVTQLLRGTHVEMFALFGRLDEPGQIRFLRRLSEVKGEEVEAFWDALFASDGPLGNFAAALENIHQLRLVAGAVPERTLQVLEQGLLGTTREERLVIDRTQRRELMWTLEQLLFRLRTSRGALRLLFLLAEAENERCGNNATGVLTESLSPFHPQIPLPLFARRAALREFFSEGVSELGKEVIVKVIEGALGNKGPSLLRQSTGTEPFDPQSTFTYGELSDYYRDLVDLLFRLAEGIGKGATRALKALPDATAAMGFHAKPHETIERFGKLVRWANGGKANLEVSPLSGALNLFRDRLSQAFDDPGFPPERRSEFEAYLLQVQQLKNELEKSNFATRLKRWTGAWAYDDQDDLSAETTPRFEGELATLAHETIKDPKQLTVELIEWLLSPAAQKTWWFFFLLGEQDEEQVLREQVELLGQRAEGAQALSAYWGGWTKRDQEAAEKRLEELLKSSEVRGDAIVLATVNFAPNPRAVERVKIQLQRGRVSPEFCYGALLSGRWTAKLTAEQFEQILQLIVGEAFEYANVAIKLFGMWMHHERPLQDNLAHFAWRCLESNPPVQPPANPWDFDRLAARLAEDNPERGFLLLEELIKTPNRELRRWDPIERHGQHLHHFWNVFHAKDRNRLFCTLFTVAKMDSLLQFHISWRLRGLLDQENDKDVLLSFGENLENAQIIASCVTTANPGFWPIAFGLIQMHSYDEVILRNLAAGVEQQGGARFGSIADFYKERKQEVEQRLLDPATPPEARAWLRDMIGRMEERIPREIVWEYDMDVDDLRHHIQDKNSSQRLWAIGRVLKYAEWADIRRLLTVDDIDEALSQVDLPEKKRRMLERAVRVWRHAE